MTAQFASPDAHRSFLNRYYGISRHFYDWTRKYYLLGRDRVLRYLEDEDWDSLVEIGPGTGRNLTALWQRRPSAVYGGIEASDEMLEHARRRCSFAKLEHGFAENADIAGLLGERPDRILYSYCLSMVVDPRSALENARNALAPGGEVVIVDFGDFSGLPGPFSKLMKQWLETFHVHPLKSALLREFDAQLTFGPGNYYFQARVGPA